MRRTSLLMIAVCSVLPILGAERTKGPLRWVGLSKASRQDLVTQITKRREGERIVIMRKSAIDLERQDDIRYPVSLEKKTRLMRAGVGDYAVFCGIYPRFRRDDVKQEGALVYFRAERRTLSDSGFIPYEVMLLCILDRAYLPKAELMPKIRMIWPKDREFCQDVYTMKPDEFVDKYGMRGVFSNSVYYVRARCLMVVDYPDPYEKDLFMFQPKYINDPDYDWDRGMFKKAQKDRRAMTNNGLTLVLSQEEASELVALVGEQWYLGDRSKYLDLRLEYPWFQPVDVDHPKTQLGKDIKTALDASAHDKVRALYSPSRN